METRLELQKKIIEKAMQEPAFKAELLADPRKALKDHFDIEVPNDVELNVFEETEKSYALVLPFAPEEDGQANAMWI
ncbi:MAG: NHLP leader peptide family RiPP precursor [Tissierellales bacterium]|jgi:hypothetical protein|nr:NHLP leader peptide family RiPP precursor [Tissierellales bacterium]